jgi:dolichol-phosphate mannosyltransferase
MISGAGAREEGPGAQVALEERVLPAPVLAVVIPTLNEAPNIAPLIARLDAALAGIPWEAVFVDDGSTDGTADAIRAIAARRHDIRCLERVGRRGLSSACIEGMLASGAAFLAVMDADLQHEETLLVPMLQALEAGDLDIVIASRFMDGSSLEDFTARRERLSRTGNRLAGLLIPVRLSDPLSGFFMMRRQSFREVVGDLSGQGFKLLLDIFASARRPLRHREFPMHFRARRAGTSKLDVATGLEFLYLLADKVFGRFVPVRFVLFVLVGLSGLAVHLVLLGACYRLAGLSFTVSQMVATLVAMTSNFYLNNIITHRDRRLRGRDFLRGLATFYLACAIGAALNFVIAGFLFANRVPWPVAGLLGAGAGSVWNYGVTSTFTWRRTRAAG